MNVEATANMKTDNGKQEGGDGEVKRLAGYVAII